MRSETFNPDNNLSSTQYQWRITLLLCSCEFGFKNPANWTRNSSFILAKILYFLSFAACIMKPLFKRLVEVWRTVSCDHPLCDIPICLSQTPGFSFGKNDSFKLSCFIFQNHYFWNEFSSVMITKFARSARYNKKWAREGERHSLKCCSHICFIWHIT